MPKWVASVASVFMSELKPVMKEWGVEIRFNNTKSREVLGIDYRPMDKTVVEMVYSMFETKALQDKRKVKL